MNIKALFWNKGIPGQNRQFEDDFSKFSRTTFEIPGFPSSVELPVAVNERIAEGKIVYSKQSLTETLLKQSYSIHQAG